MTLQVPVPMRGMDDFRIVLRHQRRAAGLTLAHAAARCELSASQLGRIERGVSDTRLYTLGRIMKAYGNMRLRVQVFDLLQPDALAGIPPYNAHATFSLDDGWVATFAEWPGLSGIGDTVNEAAHELYVALAGAVETYREEGRALPEAHDEPSDEGACS